MSWGMIAWVSFSPRITGEGKGFEASHTSKSAFTHSAFYDTFFHTFYDTGIRLRFLALVSRNVNQNLIHSHLSLSGSTTRHQILKYRIWLKSTNQFTKTCTRKYWNTVLYIRHQILKYLIWLKSTNQSTKTCTRKYSNTVLYIRHHILKYDLIEIHKSVYQNLH